MESAGSSSSENHHYTMENGGAATTAMTAQHRAIPVSSPGLLELIKKMNSQPLFQDVNYLFKDGIIWLRIPLNKSHLGKKEVPKMNKPWMKAQIVNKLRIENSYVLNVMGQKGKIISTTIANLEQGSAWTISLDVIHQQGAASLEHMESLEHPLNNLDVYPLPHYAVYTEDTIELYGGIDNMPVNHLLDEIAAILPAPNGVPTGIPMVIAPRGEEEGPPKVPRKSRKKIRARSESDPDFEFALPEDDLVNLE